MTPSDQIPEGGEGTLIAKAELLEELAYRFDVYASDQRQTIRFQKTARDRTANVIRAEVWSEAADEVRGYAKEMRADAALEQSK